jgi:hypothetical protein
MPPGPSKRQQETARAQRWAWIADKIAAELEAVEQVRPTSFRVPLLRRMLAAASLADESSLTEAARGYVRRTRVLPPGVYALCPAPGKTVYLDGERLEPGRRVASLSLAAVHAQVYR